MFTRPPEIADDDIRGALSTGWAIDAAELTYLPVGFGSHHWLARDRDGGRWFVTVDDLAGKRRTLDATLDEVFDRLRRSFATAASLHDAGFEFVVGPRRSAHGDVVTRLRDGYSIAVFPYVDGEQAGSYGEYASGDVRRDVLQCVVVLHASTVATEVAAREDFVVSSCDALERALTDLHAAWDGGPYSEPARALLGVESRAVERLLREYSRLADACARRQERFVLTHGEPHAANVLVSNRTTLLVDWDTALVAPPERDLWMLDPGDGSIIEAYADATGAPVDHDALALYRLQWDLSEIGGYVALFRAPHTDSLDAAESWKNLNHYLRPAERWPQIIN